MLRPPLPRLVAGCACRNLSTARLSARPQQYDDAVTSAVLSLTGRETATSGTTWLSPRAHVALNGHTPKLTEYVPSKPQRYDDAVTLSNLRPSRKNEHQDSENRHDPLRAQSTSTDYKSTLLVVDPDNQLHQQLIQNFNDALRKSVRCLHSQFHRKQLFACYEAIKSATPSTLNLIPPAAWSVLWKSQVSFRPLDPNRLGALEMLLNDMEALPLDVALDPQNIQSNRQVLKLEKLSESGSNNEAVLEWENQSYRLAKGHPGRKQWIELGARLYSAAGNMDSACSWVDHLLQHFKHADPRLQLFVLWRQVETGEIRKAWAMYTNLREDHFISLNTDDFQSIFSSFLGSGQQRAALEVLQDLAEYPRLPDRELCNDVLLVLIKDLHASCTKLKTLHGISLSCLEFLPQNFYFRGLFTSWLYHASRFWQAPVDTCAQIIELMFERGESPSPVHLNMLIKVWFSAKRDQSKRAESVAWDMINKRLDDQKRQSSETTNDRVQDEELIPSFLQRKIPPAITGTFLELAKGYADQGKADYAHYVIQLLQSTDLHMNQRALRSTLTILLTLNEPLKAWDHFVQVRDADPSAVNLHVYVVLWKGLMILVRSLRKTHEKVGDPGAQWHRKVRTSFQNHRFPNPRDLFADMLLFIQSTHLKPIIGHTPRVPPSIFNTVVGTMLHIGDLLGTMISMEIMQNTLGLVPDLKTIQTIVLYTAIEAKKTEAKQGIHEPIKHYEDMAFGVLEYLYVNLENHADGRKPKVSDLYNEDLIKERGVDVLAALIKYLRLLMQRYWGSEEKVDQYAFKARNQMVMSSMEAYFNQKMGIFR